MKIALVQHDITWEDKPANHVHVGGMIQRAVERGADLVCLPEMFATGFSMNAPAIREDDAGPTHRWLSHTARDRGIHLLAGVVETGTPRARNRALLYGPDGAVLERWTKLHPFTPLREHEHYEPGEGVPVCDLLGFRLAVPICYDLRFPECFRHAAVERGADLFVVPASWPATRASHWDLLARARALENLAYVAAVNRVGHGDGLDFDGRSQVVSPTGEVLARRASEEEVLVCEIDPSVPAGVREELPFLRDAREPADEPHDPPPASR